VLVLPDGSLLVADDHAGAIYRITFRCPRLTASTNIPQGTVMSRLSRARTRLKAILAGDTAPQLRVVST
jgi:hypothetical protein